MTHSESPLEQSAGKGPLSGITVLDLTRVLAGPFCTMILADLGARVIKVERPDTGDDSRAYGPFLNGASAYFQSLNRGKESIALDLKHDPDRVVFEQLLAVSDVVVENFRPGTMDAMGFGWESVHPRHPRLIYAATSGFGHTGPYAKQPAYDMVVQAMGGLMSMTGHPGQPPVRVGTSVGDITAGLFTAIGINAALVHRAVSGEGVKIDVGMLDCQVAILESAIARYSASQVIASPLGARHPSIAPFGAFKAKDGWLVIAAGNDTLFGRLCNALRLSSLVDDPRFASNAARTENAEALTSLIESALAEQSIAHSLDAIGRAGVPCGPINAIDAVMSDPQVRARNMIVTAQAAVGDTLQMAGNPIKLSKFPDPPTRRAAPAIDADRSAILAELEGRRSVVAEAPSSRSLASRFEELADALLSHKGEIFGASIAQAIVHLLHSASDESWLPLLELLAREPRRRELLQRWNTAKGGTAMLIELRERLLNELPSRQHLLPVDADLKLVLGAWLNGVGLRLERITWRSPAIVLEKLMAYEAVHAIEGWDDLRRRLAADRRCYGYFHPSLPDEPLVFLEVALLDHMPSRIASILRASSHEGGVTADHAIFYSISHGYRGVRGISLGHRLIQQVVVDLAAELPQLSTFATLSPIPGLRAWLESSSTDLERHLRPEQCARLRAETRSRTIASALKLLAQSADASHGVQSELLREVMTRLGARYLAGIGSERGPSDPVARFHLRNGASIERIHWMADVSKKGVEESYGMMVNYRYDRGSLEKNHDAFARRRVIVASESIAYELDEST